MIFFERFHKSGPAQFSPQKSIALAHAPSSFSHGLQKRQSCGVGLGVGWRFAVSNTEDILSRDDRLHRPIRSDDDPFAAAGCAQIYPCTHLRFKV